MDLVAARPVTAARRKAIVFIVLIGVAIGVVYRAREKGKGKERGKKVQQKGPDPLIFHPGQIWVMFFSLWSAVGGFHARKFSLLRFAGEGRVFFWPAVRFVMATLDTQDWEKGKSRD